MSSHRVSLHSILCTLCIAASATVATARQATDFGTLSIRVRPPDAEIFIDGERWNVSEGTGPLQLQLSPGAHRVEIRSPGRQAFVRDITIRAGETLPLNVALTGGVPAPTPESESRPQTQRQPASSSGSIAEVTRNEDGLVIAPDFRVTQINNQTATLVGAYGGYVFGGQFLVGAGGYWQANSTDGARIAYFGPVLEWRALADRTIGFNLHGLVGGGWRYADHGYYFDLRGNHVAPRQGHYYGFPNAFFDEGFFVAEPEAQVVIRFGSSLRLQAGVGYRATSAGNLSGASGSVSVQFGR